MLLDSNQFYLWNCMQDCVTSQPGRPYGKVPILSVTKQAEQNLLSYKPNF
jgi:hypothetical protein